MSKKLHEEFATLKSEAQTLIEKAKTESRDFTAEEKTANDTRFSRMEAIKNVLDADKRAAQFHIDAMPAEEVKALVINAAPAAFEKPEATDKAKYETVKKELSKYVATGSTDHFTITTASGTSALLPVIPTAPYTSRKPRNAFRLALAAFGLTPIVTGDTSKMTVPLFDDSSNTGNDVSQSATSEDNADATLTGATLDGSIVTSSQACWFSNTVILANQFDVFAYVEPLLQYRVDNKQESDWATKLINDATIVGKTTAAHNAITYSEVVAWYYSLGVQYRNDGVFFISDTLQQLLVGLTDTTGRPIFLQSLSGIAGEIPSTLLGKPAFVCSSLQTADTNTHIVGVFMSASALFIRDAGDRRLTRYAAYPKYPDQTGLELFVNGDASYAPFATKSLKMGAS